MIPLTEDSLMGYIARIKDMADDDVLSCRPKKIIIQRIYLRMAIMVMHGKHLKFMFKHPPSNARKRSKARQHQSFVTQASTAGQRPNTRPKHARTT